jgi:pimeloyl-ACP methyl ester carboxylesterase
MVILPVLERVTRAVLVRRGVESRHVDTPVGRVHLYDARGEGANVPVVMLHGIAASSTPFAPTLEKLRKRSRRVLAIDSPGHGLSEMPADLGPETLFEALAHVLDRELDAPALVVGNSLGGAMAIRYALRRPERVAGLVLSSPGGAPVEDPDERARFLRGFELESLRDAKNFLERLHHEVPWYGPLLRPDVVRLFKNPAVRAILSSLKPEHFFTPGELAALAMPIHVLWGRSDRVIPPCCLAFFKKNLPPHTVFEEPEGLGHSPHTENPRGFYRMIERNLESVSRGERATGQP